MSLLQKGDVIKLEAGHGIYCVGHKIKVTDTNDFTGFYVVIKTQLGGGGTGHGSHDIYSDGHRVFCEKLDNTKLKVDFYQTGCFTAMIENISPVGTAEKRWVVKMNSSAKEK